MLPFAREPQIPGDDYLNVNVWAAKAEDPLPVLVWIHGGGFFGGCSANPWYDGQSFAEQGLVVVSFNYRLAAEGFASVPGAPDNRGVLDWIAALEWVRDNIAEFGGDPSQVTIFGQSAGGFAVSNLLGIENARGLFHRAIIASGISRNSTMAPAVADEHAARLAAELGVNLTQEQLNSKTKDEVIAAQIALERGRDGSAETPTLDDADGSALLWTPIRDGALIRGEAVDGAQLRLSDDIPLLIGTTRDEFGWSYTLEDPDDPRGAALATEFFRRPAQELIDSRVDATAPTFRYEFRWQSTAAPGIGSAHSLDIPFFFNTLDAPWVAEFAGPDAPQQLADQMHHAFGVFARTGKPGWSAWTPANPAAMIFDDVCAVEPLIVSNDG